MAQLAFELSIYIMIPIAERRERRWERDDKKKIGKEEKEKENKTHLRIK